MNQEKSEQQFEAEAKAISLLIAAARWWVQEAAHGGCGGSFQGGFEPSDMCDSATVETAMKDLGINTALLRGYIVESWLMRGRASNYPEQCGIDCGALREYLTQISLRDLELKENLKYWPPGVYWLFQGRWMRVPNRSYVPKCTPANLVRRV